MRRALAIAAAALLLSVASAPCAVAIAAATAALSKMPYYDVCNGRQPANCITAPGCQWYAPSLNP